MLLSQCGPALGLVVAQSTVPSGEGLTLERAWFLYVYSTRYEFVSLPVAALRREQGFWAVEDLGSGRFLPEPSAIPYSVRYLSRSQFEVLESHKASDAAQQIFSFAQRAFGELPGFSYEDNEISSPSGYAEAGSSFRGPFLLERHTSDSG